MEKIFTRLKYGFYYALYVISEIGKENNHKDMNKIASHFIKYNNNKIIKKYTDKKIDGSKILILLPHCLQNSLCLFRITVNIDNCKTCGKCVIGTLKKLSEKYGVKIKVATGGTLARKYIKEIKAKLVIAVACKRDLMSGVCDAIPMDVYGVFNEIINEPCTDTSVSTEKIEEFLEMVCKR
ncbi:MAG: DUF116 domain-containing protein [Fusobacteriaceae bacterium]|nr:DUF116 domain-containing protein [Fusobacteriaceae bacterium]